MGKDGKFDTSIDKKLGSKPLCLGVKCPIRTPPDSKQM